MAANFTALNNMAGVRNLMQPRLQMATSGLCRSMSTTSTQSDDYQFMQRSKLPTMHFQRSLPRLPIPQLEKTCDRFMSAIKPIANEAQYSQAEQAMSKLRQQQGNDLNELLKQHDNANKHTSYISEPWFHMYLSDRAPLPLNYNPLLIFNHDSRPDYNNQIVRAANLVVSSLRFWRSLQSGLLEPEVFHMNPAKSDTEQFRKWMRLAPAPIATYAAYAFKAFPLDMSQYHRLFGVSRIPETTKDRLVQSTDSRHILVMRRGNMYSVQVMDAQGNIERPLVILSRLRAVLELDAKRSAVETPLGVLTASERDSWARTRTHLVGGISGKNKELLEQEVDRALFCLCLDSAEEPVYDEQDPVPLLKHMLAGSAKNRWFDKSVSLLVSHDGTAAVNFEHSWGDGVAVLRYFNEIYKETIERPLIDPTKATNAPTISDSSTVRYLDFDIDDRLRSDVAQASTKNAETMRSLNMSLLRYPQMNKVSCKRYRVSPDSIMQLSFQLAYRQLFNSYVGTYESCSTAAFRHGRTETMRPCTMATRAFCEAILQPTNKRPGAKQLREMIDQCSTLHAQLTKEAAMGQGFDRHLFALRNIAQQRSIAVPDLYSTEAYAKLNHNIISTSTLSSQALMAGAFGPVVRDGLGIAYSIQNSYCGAVVSSYEGQRNGKHFTDSLEQAFNDIRSVIELSAN